METGRYIKSKKLNRHLIDNLKNKQDNFKNRTLAPTSKSLVKPKMGTTISGSVNPREYVNLKKEKEKNW